MQERSSARFTRPEHVDLELVAVSYQKRSFPKHLHDQYVVGAVESGAERLDVGGTSHVIGEGEIITLEPGLVHSNCSLGDDLLRYRVFYLPPALVASYTSRSDLRFPTPSRTDAIASDRLLQLHRWFEIESGDRLEQESAVADVIEIAFDGANSPHYEPHLPKLVSEALRFINEHYRESFGLDELADAAGASKFHLVRNFTRTHGLSPLAYRSQRRIHEARRLVLAGVPLVEIAADLGFSDQSHLTRQFQSIIGISPARYREQ